MDHIISALIEIKDELQLNNNLSAIDRINSLISELETVQNIEIAPAQEDMIPMESGGNILITGENAHVRIYMAPQGESAPSANV